ncbi:MAG: S-layer homology domain-containing protein [Armatimonadota bacterium]
MKKTMIMVIMIMVLAISLPVFAQEFPDVPTDHWAYPAVQELAEAGIIQGYPDGTFGGKRAMTRYEFAEALAKAIPGIAALVNQGGGSGAAGKDGAPGLPGAKGDKGDKGDAGITPDQLAQLMKLSAEFRDELAALGVDVDQLKRDVADLQSRVSALEMEQKRIVINGTADFIGRGEVRFSEAPAFDRDNREIAAGGQIDNALHNAVFYTDYTLALKARVAKNANLNAVISAGNYMSQFIGATTENFTLWNLNFNVNSRVPVLGDTKLTVGRFPFELTPLTLSFVNPDSYTPINSLNQYLLDGGKATFGMGNFALTAFAAKVVPSGEFGDIMVPNLDLALTTDEDGDNDVAAVTQLAGVRATVKTGLEGKLGLTYYQTGQLNFANNADIYGADFNGALGKLAIGAEYAKSDPREGLADFAVGNGDDLNDDNAATTAKIGYDFGKLNIGGGYIKIQPNFFAPGNWARNGEAVNLTNIEGWSANMGLALTKNLKITGDYMIVEPDNNNALVTARSASSQAPLVIKDADLIDNISTIKGELKYAFSPMNTFKFGYEQTQWNPNNYMDFTSNGYGNTTDKEIYYTFGVDHMFNANSTLKLKYQIIEYKIGDFVPYGDPGSFRGGVATAQVSLKY